MRTARWPKPPVDRFVDGAVWRVVVVRRVRSDLAFRVREEYEHLLLVRANIKGRPWARTRLFVGDLEQRTKQQIYDDFFTLMRQVPPVGANYRMKLDKDKGDHIRWIDYERTMI